MSETNRRPDLRLSEAEARRALERAAWNEAQKDSLTVAELTRVAEEAGYSREFIETAIDDILAERGLSTRSAPPVQAPRQEEQEKPGLFSRLGRWLQPLKAGLIGGIIGALARSMAGYSRIVFSDGVFFMTGLVFAAVGVLAYHHRRTGRQIDFQLQAGSLWIGFMVGWAAIHGALGPEVFRAITTFWFLTGSVGGAVIHFRGIRDPSGEETPGQA